MFVMVIVALGWALSKYFGLPLSVSFHQCSMLIFIYTFLLPNEQTGEAGEPSQKQ